MKRHLAASKLGSAIRALVFGGLLALPIAGFGQDNFEPDDVPAAAHLIGNGETQSRSLHLNDTDWVKFVIGSPGATSLRIETAPLTGFSGDTEIWLYDGRDLTKELVYNDDNGTSRFSLITLGNLAAGTYYIRVASVGAESVIAGYALRASWLDRPDAFEADDTPVTARRIANGETQERSLHLANDVDWATFTIGSSGATNLRIETSGSSGDTEMWLYGPNSSTTQLAYNDDAAGSKFAVIALSSVPEGTYFIKVNSFGLGATMSGYNLRASWVDRGDAFESDDISTAARPIPNGISQSRSIHVVGDVDWVTFSITGNGATNVRIETTTVSGDTELWLYGPNNAGTLVAYNDDAAGGKFSVISLNTLGVGTYYVKVNEFGNDATIGAYSLRVAWTDALPPAPGDSFEPDDTPVSAKTIGNGESQPRTIHRDADVDWARFTIGPNGAFNVRLETVGTAGDTEMWLYGPDSFSTQLSYNDDGGSGKFAAISVNTLTAGVYYVRITSYRQASAIPAYSLRASWVDGSVSPASTRISNLSIRTSAGTGAQTLIVGFVVSGAGPKQLLLRAVGPTLANFGVGGTLADPSLQLFGGNVVLATNDNWAGDPAIRGAAVQVGAFPIPEASRDAALLQVLEAGSYSVVVGGGTGVALVEAYDAGSGALPRFTNVSARAQVGTGAEVLIAGFVISGPAPKTVLIRAVGPGLAPFGVTGVLADPRLDVFRGATPIESNDNWGGGAALTTTFAQVGAFALPAASRDAALMLTLAPGAYSAQISGVGATTGTALVEIYEAP